MEKTIKILYFTNLLLFICLETLSVFFTIYSWGKICDNYLYLSPSGVFFLILTSILMAFNFCYYLWYYKYFFPNPMFFDSNQSIEQPYCKKMFFHLFYITLNSVIFIEGMVTLFNDNFTCIYPYPIIAITIWALLILPNLIHSILLLYKRKYLIFI